MIGKKQLWHWSYVAFVCSSFCWLCGCAGPNHGALCDNALAAGHTAFEKKDYARASQFLKVAAAEAELSDQAVQKSQVLREQVTVSLAQDDPKQAEEFARQLVRFEQGQEHVESSSGWHFQWAEDMVRADMLVGDALRAQDRKQEALAVYKEAIDKAKELSAPMALEASISERYAQTSKALRGGELCVITDTAAADDALENYSDLRVEMYNYRTVKDWAKLSATAEKVAALAAQCKQIDGGVSAYNVAAFGEYMLGHSEKARGCAKKAIALAHEHPDDKRANESAANSWLFIAITDDSTIQAKKDALTAFSLDWVNADSSLGNLAQNLDQSRWNKVCDWFSELGAYGMRLRSPANRLSHWLLWTQQNLDHKSLDKEYVWAERMFARKQIDQQDMADCHEAVLDLGDKAKGISQKERCYRANRAMQIREVLRKQSPNDNFNLAHLACDYEIVGQVSRARELAQNTQRGIKPDDPLYSYLTMVINRCNNDKNTHG